MRRTPALKLTVVAVITASLVSACTSDPSSEVDPNFTPGATTSPTSTAPAGPPDLGKVVLTVADMPTGWTTTTNPVAVSLGEAGCLKTASQRSMAKQARYVTFAGSGGAPIISESLAAFTTADIQAHYDAGVKLLEKCKKVEIKAGTVTFTGPVIATSAPTVGEQSQVFTLAATGKGHTLTEYIIYARQGAVLFMTTYASVKTPVITDFLTVTAKAAVKLAK